MFIALFSYICSQMVLQQRFEHWLLVLCVLFATQLHALDVKHFTYSHLGIAEGVDNQRIFSVCQTSSGAIWWSSMKGVGRYNGSKVRIYRLDDGTPFAHLGGRVIKIAADDKAIYAFDNRGSIYLFQSILDGFKPIASISKKLGHEVALNDIYVKDGKLFLALHDGVYLLNDTTLTQVMKAAYVNQIVPMMGHLLFCARDGVYNEKGKRLLSYNTEYGYYDEMSGRLWVGGYENGLHVVSLSQNGKITADEFVRISDKNLYQNPIRSICPYDDDTMLIGIDGLGVYQMSRDGRGGCALLFDANESEHSVLHGNGVYTMLVDSWKNIVIGTYSGGIDIARPISTTTAIYQHLANNRQSLLNDNVNMVMPLSMDVLLMGTDNGISIKNLTTGQWQHCCEGTVVLNACKKADGSVLVSTYGKGVIEIDSRANVHQVYTKENSFLTDDHVYATLYDKDGGLWVGSLNGDLVYSPISQIGPKQADCRYYPVHDVQAITQLASGQIAVGTAFGLKLITPGSTKVEELNYTPSGVTDVNPFVTHLLASGMELWIATDGGGVYVYHLTKHQSRQITTANGLPSNYVRSLVKSRDGRIWIATDEGLAFVKSGDASKVVNANYCYGLNREYSRGAAQLLPDGDIIFGSTTGAIIIHPENVQPLNYTVNIAFLGVNCDVDSDKLQNRKVYQLLNQGRLSLSYSQRTFDLLFESVNMRNHFDIVYRYKIGKGEWSTPTDQQHIRFVNLEPGKHQLTLQCLSRTTGTVLDSKTLVISIAQPWWSSWWMWCIYIALVLLAFYGSWKVYKLHEKYMRLTIAHMKSDDTVSPSPVPIIDEHDEAQTSDADEMESDFVDEATQLILEHLSDSDYSIDSLCREMAMSRTLFYVKLKSFTGKSPQDFIRIIRLERAAQMLRNGRSVSDAAALTGFENPKYFSTVFKKYFGVSPSKYQ
jgi:AraC-like DNA-binding protein/ligand-binding sensor domain-containing protein